MTPLSPTTPSPAYRPAHSPAHSPVLCGEVTQALAPKADGIYVDATYGGGGYSRAWLDSAACQVIAIDRDPEAIARGQKAVHDYGGRLVLIHGRFSGLAGLLAHHNVSAVDGVAFDFGVSSLQLDDPARGFSFRHDSRLDMRMDGAGGDAGEFINTASQSEIADVLWELGEEKAARRIARAIVAARPINTTGRLASVIRETIGGRKKTGGQTIDPATRSFQAIRMRVNNELDEIKTALPQAVAVLKTGGRLACVAFHSLEDRLVKGFIREAAGKLPRPSRHQPMPTPANTPSPSLRLVTSKPIRPSADEMAMNPRARSARLRVAEKCEVAACVS